VPESPTIIGVEVEYALAPRNSRDSSSADIAQSRRARLLDPLFDRRHDERVSALIARVRRLHPFLLAERTGVFLGNGARLYKDRAHLEYSTPEASTPLEAAAQLLAGRRLLFEALASNPRLDPHGDELALYDINVDYAEPLCAAWACHENYSFSGCSHAIRRAILPHLCSRAILTGGGGFHPHRPLVFVLSPRALIHPDSVCPNACQDVTFFHPRLEPYSTTGIDRLHIVCGESLRSHRAIYLKLGITALIVFLAQHNHEIDCAFQPTSPREAFQTFSADPTGEARAACQTGQQKSALEIQWGLLGVAQRAALELDLPLWAPQVIELWRDSLGQFSQGRQHALQYSFDWAMKWSVFDAFARKAGMPLDQLLLWDTPLARLTQIAKDARAAVSISELDPARLTPAMLRQCVQSLAREGHPDRIEWRKLPLVLDLRKRLRELDWRFCQVGDGIFEQLSREGWLDHHAPQLSPQKIQAAMTDPPQDTRAKPRGHWIKLLHNTPRAESARVDWQHIIDPDRQKILRLPHPAFTDAAWSSTRKSDVDPNYLFDLAIRYYEISRFMESATCLRRARAKIRWDACDPRRVNTYPFRVLRYSAWVGARLGRFDCLQYLEKIHGPGLPDAWNSLRLADHLYCSRFLGLVPHLNMDKLIPTALQFFRSPPETDEPRNANVREHVAAFLLANGKLAEAMEMIKPCESETALWRRVRAKCIMADTARRLGWNSIAAELLAGCRSIIPAHNALLAEQVVPAATKLEPNRRERARSLVPATETLREARHPMALARLLLMRVRDCRDTALARFIRREFGSIRLKTPALRQCPLAQKICKNWTAWTMTFTPDESGDLWWGL
jgi:hypothetical protein